MREKSMIPELLREIVAKGESLNVEFKGEEKAALSDSALVEAIICLANRSGVEPGGSWSEWKTMAATPAPGRATPEKRLKHIVFQLSSQIAPDLLWPVV